MPRDPKLNRLDGEVYSIELFAGYDNEGKEVRHAIDFAVMRTPSGDPHEIQFRMSKPGTSLDLMMHDLSIGVSRAMQRRDPLTGEAL